MVKIMYVNPPVRMTEQPKHAPYGIMMLAAQALSWGARATVVDCNIDRGPLDVLRDQVKKDVKLDEAPDIIAFSGLVTTYGWQKAAIAALKRDHPRSLVISGGGLASALHMDFLRWVPELDAVAYGEGERTQEEILRITEAGTIWEELKTVKGVCTRSDLPAWAKLPEKPSRQKRKYNELIEGRKTKPGCLQNPPQRLLTEDELNELPFPNWDLIVMDNELDELDGRRIKGYFNYSPLPLSDEAMRCVRRIDIIGERGCPASCRFCSHNLLGGDYLRPDHYALYGDQCLMVGRGEGRLKPLIRYFSPKWVVDCITHALIHLKIDFVAFQDETMLWNRKRVSELCDLLEERDLVGSFNWGCLGRPEAPDSALLNKIKQAGCTYISYGFESSSQPNLDYLEKYTTVDGQRATLKATLEAGINPITSYIIGYPEETMQTLYDTARFWALNDVIVSPFFLTPYPYTRVYWENMDKILAKYGSEEAFTEACGDAHDLLVNLTSRFTDAELLGLREMMARHDLDGLRRHSEWRISAGLDDEPIKDDNPPKTEIVDLVAPIG